MWLWPPDKYYNTFDGLGWTAHGHCCAMQFACGGLDGGRACLQHEDVGLVAKAWPSHTNTYALLVCSGACM